MPKIFSCQFSVRSNLYLQHLWEKHLPISQIPKELTDFAVISIHWAPFFFFFWLSWSTEIKCSSKKDIWYQIVLIGPLSVNNPWITYMPEEYLLIHRTCTWLMIWPVINMTLCVQILGIFLNWFRTSCHLVTA